jgi:hypothetical protein
MFLSSPVSPINAPQRYAVRQPESAVSPARAEPDAHHPVKQQMHQYLRRRISERLNHPRQALAHQDPRARRQHPPNASFTLLIPSSSKG